MSTDAPPPQTTRRQAGLGYEAEAEAWLQQRGLVTVARNFNCRVGEIDLVMLDGDTLVFVEVRYRRDARFGGAAASIDRRKQQKLIRAAQVFLQAHRQYAERSCRFDVVALQGSPRSLAPDWIAGAFSA